MKSFLFIILFVSITSFYVYEKIPLATYVAKVRKELKEIMSFHYLEELTINDFNCEIDNKTYTLSSVKAKSVFFNSFMLEVSIENPVDLSLKCSWFSPENSTSYISPYHLTYTAEIIDYNNKSFPIEFELESEQLMFVKKWELYEKDKFYVPTGSMQVIFAPLKVKNLEENSPLEQETIIKIINAFLKAYSPDMNHALHIVTQAYYKSLPFEESIQKIYTQTSNIPKENNFDLTLETMPEYDNITNINATFIIFKRKGTLNGEEIKEGSIVEDDTNIQRFNLHRSIYQKLITENIFNITFEQTNNPAYMYELTGKYLKQVATLNETIDDTTQLKLEAIMGDITFNDQDAMLGEVTLGINILSIANSSKLFGFSVKFNFKFNPTLFQNGLNFVLLSKNLKINEVIPDPDYEILDETLLIQWIENTYLCALGNNEYTLSKLALDLSYYFNTNDLSMEFLGEYLSIKKN